MNILFMSLLEFDSIDEQNIYTDLLREFIENGHEVYIISPVERRKRQKTQVFQRENHVILRPIIGNIQKTNFVEKGISTVLLERQLIKAIKKYWKQVSFDLVLYSTPPITFQKVIKYVKKKNNAISYLLLKDIFPQNAVDLGLLKKNGLSGILYRFFRKKEKNLYAISDYIGCMSKANVEYIIQHNPNIDKNKLEVCPNSIRPNQIIIDSQKKISIKCKYNITFDKTIFLYGGNLGKPQGVDFLIKCIKEIKNPNVFFLIVGSGTEYNTIQTFLKNSNVNAKLLDHLNRNEYETVVSICDVGLIFLDKRFTIPNFPSRILSYLQAGIPVLAATDVNTDMGQVIINGGFGCWCEHGDLTEFCRLVDYMSNKQRIVEMGSAARTFLIEHYTADKSYNIIMSHIND